MYNYYIRTVYNALINRFCKHVCIFLFDSTSSQFTDTETSKRNTS